MRKLAERSLMPLLFANITIAANMWSVLGVEVGQVLFWMIIATSWFVTARTPYRNVTTLALLGALLLRGAEAFYPSVLIEGLRHVALAVVFVAAGATVYGRDPRLLHRQLVIFFAMCIPVMLLQMLGASSFFMAWNKEYPDSYLIPDVGAFGRIPVYPTLFVGPDEGTFLVGQGRPVGLLYSNNPLSVFVAIAAALGLGLARTSRVRGSDIVVLCALVLTMSLTGFLSVLLIYGACFVWGSGTRRRQIVKLNLLILFFAAAYYFFFPGLFLRNFSEPKLLQSVLTRAVGLSEMVGIQSVRRLYEDNIAYLGQFIVEGNTYSGVAQILQGPMGVAAVVVSPLLLWLYVRRIHLLRRTSEVPATAYGVTAMACVLTQFGVPYFGAPSFQFLLGFAAFPLFRRLWPRPPDDGIKPADPLRATA